MSVRPTYELIRHTADIGIRLHAPGLDQLFATAAAATFDLIIDLDSVQEKTRRDFHIEGVDREDILVSWLNDLIYVFEVEGLVLGRFDVQVDSQRLQASGYGEPYDPERHAAKLQLKAATYHGLRLEETAEGAWTVQIIFDI